MAEAGCSHFFHIKPKNIRTDLAKLSSPLWCSGCKEATVDPWFCLSCSQSLCGRGAKGHMLTHSTDKKHPLVVSLTSVQIWCYQCDDDFDQSVEKIEDERMKSKAENLANDVRMIVDRRLKKETARTGVATTQPQVVRPAPVTRPADDLRPSLQPRGLSNLGNTCFFNSSLQCLNATQLLVSQLPNLLGRTGPVNTAIARVVEAMHLKGKDTNPKELHSAVVGKYRQFKGFGQHDSHELLRCMLDAMATEQTKAKISPTLIEYVFGGKLLSSVMCAGCIHSGREQTMSRSLDPIMDISLEMSKKTKRADTLPDLAFHWRREISPSDFTDHKPPITEAVEPDLGDDSEPTTSLDGCLAAFTRCETLIDRDNQYDCPRCREKNPAVRRLLIYELPKVLVLHIKRFSSHGRTPTKLTSFVGFPVNLNVTKYCVSHAGKTIPSYRLYAVSVHSGGMSGGHYVAYVKHGEAWFHCSDTHVSKVSESDVLRAQAYVLFYQSEEDTETSTQAEDTSEPATPPRPGPKPNRRYEEESIETDFDG